VLLCFAQLVSIATILSSTFVRQRQHRHRVTPMRLSGLLMVLPARRLGLVAVVAL
jgi:hypothetical protein